MNKTNFFKRNLWGLVALLPVTAAFGIVALDRTGYFDVRSPGQAVTAEPTQWVAYSDAKLRLLNLVTTADLYDGEAKPVKLPDQVRAWRAVIEIQVSDQRSLDGCQLSLEDSAGRVFGTQPSELSAVRMPPPTCTAEDKGLNTYQVTVLFVTPAEAKPVAVRVMRPAALPAYARLPAA